MFSFIGSLFSGLVNIVVDIVRGLIKFVIEHPALTLVIVLMVASNAATWHFTKKDTTAKVTATMQVTIDALKLQIAGYNKEIEARNAKITELEAESKVIADTLDKELAASKKRIGDIVDGYEAELEKERAKLPPPVIVQPPNPDAKPVEVHFVGDEVVCRRFYDRFVIDVNKMVDEANKKVDLP